MSKKPTESNPIEDPQFHNRYDALFHGLAIGILFSINMYFGAGAMFSLLGGRIRSAYLEKKNK